MQNTVLKRCFIHPVRSCGQRCWFDHHRSVTQPLIWSSAPVFSPLIQTHYAVLRAHRRPAARTAPWIPLSLSTLFCFVSGFFFAITHINKALNSLQPAPCNELIRCRRCGCTVARCAVKAAGNPRRHACRSGGERQRARGRSLGVTPGVRTAVPRKQMLYNRSYNDACAGFKCVGKKRIYHRNVLFKKCINILKPRLNKWWWHEN